MLKNAAKSSAPREARRASFRGERHDGARVGRVWVKEASLNQKRVIGECSRGRRETAGS
jgi:hypothetical protein